MFEIVFTKKYEKVAKKFFKKHQNLKSKYAKVLYLLKQNHYIKN
jgi:mRNA-degrading endonuclease YafQ of YafQ-DinJ toxin-antitoxin module